MQIKLWGVRGSLPTPMAREEYRYKLLQSLERAREIWREAPDRGEDAVYAELSAEQRSVIGGETTCVEVVHEDAQLIFDMGTGARKLGLDMLQRGRSGDIYVLLTHTHWDHIQGFPHFAPAFDPAATVHFFSCIDNLPQRFSRQQHLEHFRMSFADTPCGKVFHFIEPGEPFAIGPFTITTKQLIHPGGSAAYKVEAGGKTFIFATDTEFYGPELHQQMADYSAFFDDADLLVMDAQYSLEEAEQKKGWGHTAMTIAVDCSLHWKVRELVLTHHEPAHSDGAIWKLFDEASEYLREFSAANASAGPGLQIYTAREGDVYSI